MGTGKSAVVTQRRPRFEVGARNRNEEGISPVRGETICMMRDPSIVDQVPVAGVVNMKKVDLG